MVPRLDHKLYTELTELKLRKKELDRQIPTVMVMQEAEKPRDTHVLARGDYRNRGEGTPRCSFRSAAIARRTRRRTASGLRAGW